MSTKRTTLLAVVMSTACISVAVISAEKPEVSAPRLDNAQLVNFSTRGFVGTGEQVMIPGFVVSGYGGKTFLIRAVGPTLGTLGVEGALQDPYMSIRREPVPGMYYPDMVIGNDDWDKNGLGAVVAQVAQHVGAFALLPASKDAALVTGLGAGVYTVVVGSSDGGTGVVLVEIAAVAERVGAFALTEGSTDAAILIEVPAGVYTALVSDASGTEGIALVEVYTAP